jgi:hypothetical protein
LTDEKLPITAEQRTRSLISPEIAAARGKFSSQFSGLEEMCSGAEHATLIVPPEATR